jgi:hypothetical protein
MKEFISNSLDVYERITSETETHYICNKILYSKADVITEYYPLDNLKGILHLVTVNFCNY